MGGKGSGNKHNYDFESAVVFYVETLCGPQDLMSAYHINYHQAKRVIDEGVERMKHRVRMNKLTQQIEEFNPERELN